MKFIQIMYDSIIFLVKLSELALAAACAFCLALSSNGNLADPDNCAGALVMK